MLLAFNSKKYCGKQFGEYTIIRPVGEGRYGRCYLASSITGSPVIIKHFKQKIHKKNKEKNEFEAIILSQLRHDKIPKLLGIIHQKNFFGFVLELKQGDTIEFMLFKQKHIFNEIEIYHIGIQLISVIKYLHYNGVVHRDIRCANVLYDGSNISLVDFGLARWADCKQYKPDIDFSYLGDLLLYLLYSSFDKHKNHHNLPWHEELSISNGQKLFLKKLLRLEPPYKNISEVEYAFISFFTSKNFFFKDYSTDTSKS